MDNRCKNSSGEVLRSKKNDLKRGRRQKAAIQLTFALRQSYWHI